MSPKRLTIPRKTMNRTARCCGRVPFGASDVAALASLWAMGWDFLACDIGMPGCRNHRDARIICRSPIETSPASPIEMSRSLVCLRLVEVAWDDGDHDEPQRADAPAGADRHC